MERQRSVMKRQKNYIGRVILAMSFLMSVSAMAGTVFAPSAGQNQDPSDGDYPPSSFGSPPVNGFSEGFAARQVIDMESSQDGSDGLKPAPSRGLASVSASGLTGDTPISMSQAAPAQAGTKDIPPSVVSRRGVQEVSVIASDLGFFPKTIFVSRSVPVRMYVTSASKNTLCIMMDSFQVRKQLRSDKIEEITFLPNVPGKYRFYCPVNGMEGTMIVKEFSSPFQLSDQESTQYSPGPSAVNSRGLASETQRTPSVQAQWESSPAIDSGESGE